MDIAHPMKPIAMTKADYSKRRHQPEKDDLELGAAGQAWLGSIEESIRPMQLAAAFPRIVNRMAKLWKAPREMDRYFEELLTDTRQNRQGFPLKILIELGTLKDYYQEQVPLVHRHGERAHLAFVVDREGGVGHRAADVAARHRDGHVAGALVGNVESLDAELGVEALVRGVVRRVDPRAAEGELPGLGFRRLDEVLEGLEGAGLGHYERVRGVVEPVCRRDVLGLVLHLAFERREHDVRQVDSDDVQAVRGQGVQLVPHDGAAHPRLVLDDGLDRGAFLLQHELLVPRRYVGFAPGRESLPVQQVFLGAGLPERRRSGGQGQAGEQTLHGRIVLLNSREVYPKNFFRPERVHSALRSIGSRMRATRPPPSRASSSKLPRCARTTRSTMASPRPAPPLSLRATSRRVNGCFSRSASESGMPGPRSATSSTAAPPSARTATRTSPAP